MFEMAAIPPERPYLDLPFALNSGRQGLEARLLNGSGFSGYLMAVEIVGVASD